MKVKMKMMKMKTWRNKRLMVTACHDLCGAASTCITMSHKPVRNIGMSVQCNNINPISDP